MAERNGTCSKDRGSEEPMPLLVVPLWKTIAEENARNPSAGLWKASGEEASAPGESHPESCNCIFYTPRHN